MSKCTEFTGSLYGISPITYKSFMDMSIPLNVSFDVIGVVSNCDKILLFNGDKTKIRMSLTIKNLDEKIDVTLWEPYVTQFEEYSSSTSNNGSFIIVFQFARFNDFKGHYSVANSFNVSRLFINSEIEEINSFRNSLIAQFSFATSSTTLTIGSNMSSSFRANFLTKYDFVKIVNNVKIEKRTSAIIFATIKSFRKDIPWFYMGCKNCARKVNTTFTIVDKPDGSGEVEEHETYECLNCVDQNINVLPRYKIQLMVEDSTGIVALTLFDREGGRVLKKSAHDFFQDNVKKGDKDDFPEEFGYLIGKKYAFKIDITDYNLPNNYHTYGISKLTDDEEIITDLQHKAFFIQSASSQSIDILGSHVGSEGNTYVKDDSCMGENVTQSSDYTPTSNKRKVGRLSDDDGAVQMFTTKCEIFSTVDGNDEATMEKSVETSSKTLLVPKKEK